MLNFSFRVRSHWMSISSSCTSGGTFSLSNEKGVDTSSSSGSIFSKSEKRRLNSVWRCVRVVDYLSVWRGGTFSVASVGKCVKQLLLICRENRISLAVMTRIMAAFLLLLVCCLFPVSVCSSCLPLPVCVPGAWAWSLSHSLAGSTR